MWCVLTSSSPGLHCLICDKSFSVSTELSIIRSGCIPNSALLLTRLWSVVHYIGKRVPFWTHTLNQ
jgi:hypothetical protein